MNAKPMRWLMACAAIVAAMTAGARAQEPEAATRPAFSLASSQIYTTKDSPSIDLTFQQVDHLDFRIYRVKDAKAFFAGLKDPHQFGSPEPVVAQEQTWLEWLAEWKSSRRSEVRDFVRRQVSPNYRTERRKQIDKGETSRRQMLRYTTFAQVPLLNQSQLVASWREMLPRVREAESRRLPLDLPGPGAYLVEAVNPPHRAYTIVVVSDVGLVTKAAPKQALMFAANRFSGEPLGNCVDQRRRRSESRCSRAARRATARRSRRSTPPIPTRSSPSRSAATTSSSPIPARISSRARRAISSPTSTPTSRSTGPVTPCG